MTQLPLLKSIKRDVNLTFDRTPQTANKVNLIELTKNFGFIVVKPFLSQERFFKSLMTNQQRKHSLFYIYIVTG